MFGWEMPWYGRSKFCCKGKLFMGPKSPYRYLVYLLIFALVSIQLLVFTLRDYFLFGLLSPATT